MYVVNKAMNQMYPKKQMLADTETILLNQMTLHNKAPIYSQRYENFHGENILTFPIPQNSVFY